MVCGGCACEEVRVGSVCEEGEGRGTRGEDDADERSKATHWLPKHWRLRHERALDEVSVLTRRAGWAYSSGMHR
jgi:hypothetical protein